MPLKICGFFTEFEFVVNFFSCCTWAHNPFKTVTFTFVIPHRILRLVWLSELSALLSCSDKGHLYGYNDIN